MGTNATFYCSGNGEIQWEINDTQVLMEQQVQLFAQLNVYVPLPTLNISELIMTATEINNLTRTIICHVGGFGVGQVDESDPVFLLVYGE